MTIYLVFPTERWDDIPRARGTFDVKATTDLTVVKEAMRMGVLVLRVQGDVPLIDVDDPKAEP